MVVVVVFLLLRYWTGMLLIRYRSAITFICLLHVVRYTDWAMYRVLIQPVQVTRDVVDLFPVEVETNMAIRVMSWEWMLYHLRSAMGLSKSFIHVRLIWSFTRAVVWILVEAGSFVMVGVLKKTLPKIAISCSMNPLEAGRLIGEATGPRASSVNPDPFIIDGWSRCTGRQKDSPDRESIFYLIWVPWFNFKSIEKKNTL